VSTTTSYTNTHPIDEMFNNIRNIISSQPIRSDYIPYVEERDSVSYKLGKYTRKTVSYFKRSETKTSVLIATWAVESLAYALTFLVLVTSGAFITAALWTALYGYITYAFFAMLRDAAVVNVIFTKK